MHGHMNVKFNKINYLLKYTTCNKTCTLKTATVTPYIIPDPAPVFDLEYTYNLPKIRNA
jgi:hypothetical protein